MAHLWLYWPYPSFTGHQCPRAGIISVWPQLPRPNTARAPSSAPRTIALLKMQTFGTLARLRGFVLHMPVVRKLRRAMNQQWATHTSQVGQFRMRAHEWSMRDAHTKYVKLYSKQTNANHTNGSPHSCATHFILLIHGRHRINLTQVHSIELRDTHISHTGHAATQHGNLCWGLHAPIKAHVRHTRVL